MKKTKKLTIKRETLRSLDSGALKNAAGGRGAQISFACFSTESDSKCDIGGGGCAAGVSDYCGKGWTSSNNYGF